MCMMYVYVCLVVMRNSWKLVLFSHRYLCVPVCMCLCTSIQCFFCGNFNFTRQFKRKIKTISINFYCENCVRRMAFNCECVYESIAYNIFVFNWMFLFLLVDISFITAYFHSFCSRHFSYKCRTSVCERVFVCMLIFLCDMLNCKCFKLIYSNCVQNMYAVSNSILWWTRSAYAP